MKATTKKKKVLLAFGEGALNQATLKILQGAGFQVTQLNWTRDTRLPKTRYDYLIQLGKDPIALTKGTRQLLEKAKDDKAEFLLISSLKVTTKTMVAKEATYRELLCFAEALTTKFHKRGGTRAAILRLPTIFGPGIPPAESETLGHLISEFASDQATLTIYGEGKDRNYYLYLTDAVKAIKTILSAKGKEGKVYFAVPPAPTSSAAIAEILMKIGEGRYEIHYHKGLTPIEEEAKLEGEALTHFKPDTSLAEGILQTLKALPTGGGKTPNDREKKTLSIRVPYLRRPTWGMAHPWQLGKKKLFQLIIILLLLSPLPYIGGRTLLATYHLSQLRHQTSVFDFQAASQSAEALTNDLTSLNQVFGMVPFFSRRTPLYDLQLLSQGGVETSTALTGLLAEGGMLLTTFENLIKSYQGEAINKQTDEEFNRLTAAFKKAEDRLLTALGYLNQTHPTLRQLITPYLDLFQEGLPATKLGGAFAAAGSELLGYQGERSYLILFQNSAEIWAGGGAVTSLAHLSLKEGGIETLKFYDFYDFKNVKGIKEKKPAILGSGTRPPTYIALSPNFSNNAKFMNKVFERATGVASDGVIGVDLHFAEELLNITGPLQLPNLETKITSGNLFEIAETEVEKGFFPGSTKKKRFMRALGEGLLSKLFAIERRDYAKVAQLAWEQLQGKGILLYLTNPELYQAVVESNLAGLIGTAPGDYLLPLDHNTGTKGTVWVKRKIAYKVYNSDREGTLRSELMITWQNEGTSSWPAGNYSIMFRVLIPKEARLVSAHLWQGLPSVGNQNSEDVTGKILITEEVGKGEFGIRLKIAPQTARTLKLVYNLPKSLNLKNLTRYTLYVQKQPGTVGDAFTFTFEEPFGKRISGEGLQRVGSSLTLEKKLERDITLEVVIEAKEEQ